MASNKLVSGKLDSASIISLVRDILAKKELKNLDESFVDEKLKAFLEKNKELEKKIKLELERKSYNQFQRSKEHELIIKKIRAELREIYGVFILNDYAKRHGLLKKLAQEPSLENHNKVLELHKSSKERLPYYGVAYKKIFEVTGIPKKIVDLACGLNPISYPYIAAAINANPEYLACDLAKKDLEFIQEYFRLRKINGKTSRLDLIGEISRVPSITKGSDIVFLFKTLDSLESVKWNISKELLESISSKFIVVSFATKSIGGKKSIKKDKRGWFERLLAQKNLVFRTFEIPGEVFYIIQR
ncbi:hypothetical protein JXB28_03880 [Candidatus Woesearchaeota archaeon]|nr:hypothetical protein [Candidatus Woesearchaeota archaeon]